VSAPLHAESEDSALSKDQFRELLKLRGEVALLRRQNESSEQSGNHQPLRAQHQYPAGLEFTPDGKLITTNLDGTVRVWDLSTAQEVVPKDKWTFAGYSDPESTLKTLTWAMSHGDLKNMIASVTEQEGANISKDLGGKTEAEIASELADISGVRIIKKDVVSENEVIMTLFADGKDEVVRLKFQRFGTEWKMAGKALGK
jgi:WD40 repeat protein